jgi:hypothetical protein
MCTRQSYGTRHVFTVINTKVTEFTYYKHHLFMIKCVLSTFTRCWIFTTLYAMENENENKYDMNWLQNNFLKIHSLIWNRIEKNGNVRILLSIVYCSFVIIHFHKLHISNCYIIYHNHEWNYIIITHHQMNKWHYIAKVGTKKYHQSPWKEGSSTHDSVLKPSLLREILEGWNWNNYLHGSLEVAICW